VKISRDFFCKKQPEAIVSVPEVNTSRAEAIVSPILITSQIEMIASALETIAFPREMITSE